MDDRLAERFEDSRPHLRSVAYRMLGSLPEADDAVQESWLRVSRGDTAGVRNWTAWLTTVVAHVCLDMLRARRARPEDPAGALLPEPDQEPAADPEQEALLADSVGLALLVVLDALGPAERLAFVLHDMFAVPFEEIAPIVGRSATATRQLASRARRRVRGRVPGAAHDLPVDADRQREVVDAFLAASRDGDFDALLALLHPDVEVVAELGPATRTVRGSYAVAEQALLFRTRTRFAQPALVDGALGIVIAPRGRLATTLGFTFTDGRIARLRIVGDPDLLARQTIAVLD
jgi:RNA polymerase sigma-70 factor, ECF subfamily